MSYRNVVTQTYAHEFQMGPMRVKQPLPVKGLEQVSPFILLHHAGPQHHDAGKGRTRLNPHPHRGFEPVTFLFSGKLHHKDSLGNEGFLESGDVQWMTAGSGIIHSEGPSAAFAREGGDMELIQLWVNLPKAHKMASPKYQDIKKQTIPSLRDNGFEFQVVAGTFRDLTGPAKTFTPILAMMVHFEAGSETVIPVSQQHNALAYVLEGSVASNGNEIEALHMALFDHAGTDIQLKARTNGKLLFLSGAPIDEPLVSYGPFVMNTDEEIRQAVFDYENGRMGELVD